MFLCFLVKLLLLKTASTQVNGDFWWLHEKAIKLQQIEPDPPKFEDFNEFETDDTVKIVFKDNEIYSKVNENDNLTEIEAFLNQGEILPNVIIFKDQSELAKPMNLENSYLRKNNKSTNAEEDKVLDSTYQKREPYIQNGVKSQSTDDVFEFMFPKSNEVIWENKVNNYTQTAVFNDSKAFSTKNDYRPNTIVLNNKVLLEDEKKQYESESICTFINKEECTNKNGTINMPGSCPRKIIFETQNICCIIPLATKVSSKVQYPHKLYTLIKRYKRSESGDQFSSVLRQRNALLMRNHSQINKNKVIATTVRAQPAIKIVTPDYIDPYWNVKNSKIRKPSTQSITNQDYHNPDYTEEYSVELPRPGLVGIYSENDKLQGATSWKVKDIKKGFTYGGSDEVSEEEDGDGDIPFGYSSFDPRLGVSTKKPRPIRRKSTRVTMVPRDDIMQQSESQTVNFHSTPDFHVLQGFKLINLAGNQNRHVRKTTTERFNKINGEESLETLSTISSDDEYIDTVYGEQQAYKLCGRNIKTSGKDITENGCDPWLAIVVSTKNPESILCYATIVHPRAAVTAADCVSRKTIGEFTIITGVWDLKQDRENSQQRMSTIYIHQQFNAGNLDNNLAILHWKRPLRIDSKVLPACLGDPHVGDRCYFVGWGGYDQALQPRPHWQHATILSPRECNEKMSSPDINIPTDAYCASVRTRGTVTGVGGPLLCKSGDRISVVGVAVYRDSIVVLLPVFEWILTALRDLQIH